MPRVTQYFPPDLSWGWLPEYVTSGRSFTAGLMPGQWVAKMPILAPVPNQKYLDAGITHLIHNVGQPNNDIPMQQQACMSNGDFLVNTLGPNFNSWTVAGAENAVASFFQARNGGFNFFLGQIMEAIGNTGVTTQANYRNSAIDPAVTAKAQQLLNATGGRAYGDYDGHMSLLRFDDFANPDQFRAAFNSPGEALSLAQSATPFSNGFYTKNEYNNRHGCIKIYQTGNVDSHKVVTSMILGMAVDQRARQAVGTSRRVCVAGFSGYDETLGQDAHSAYYSRAVPAGGVATRATFAQWSYLHQIWMNFRALASDFDVYDWESEDRFGTDPNVVLPNSYDQFSYSGPAQRASPSYFYNTGAVGYPGNPFGCQDIVPVAADMKAFIAPYAGHNWYYTPHQTGGSSPTSVNSTYIIDRYQDNQGECLLFRNGNSNNICVAFCATGWASGETRTVTVPLPNGNPLVFQAFAATPALFRIDLTQSS